MLDEPKDDERPSSLDDCWRFDESSGFLLAPDPIVDLRTVESGLSAEVAATVHELGVTLPSLIRDGDLRAQLDDLSAFAMAPAIELGDGRVLERLVQIYSHLANGYVWCDQSDPIHHLPPGVAVPLVEVSKALGRPPVMAYVSTALTNFERVDPAGDLSIENLRCVQEMIETPDEAWFHLIHVEIEWHGAAAVAGCLKASGAAQDGAVEAMTTYLEQVPPALDRMIGTFKRMGEGCSPDYYYRTLRPYLFGFTDIVYRGVAEFRDEPQTFRGESGAQSSLIPVLQRLLGLQHRDGGLSEDLEAMVSDMPIPHQTLLRGIDSDVIRSNVVRFGSAHLREVYNECLQGILDFRSLHLNMARAYIASRVEDPTGTGGTDFMRWLTQLRDETAQQLL